jgi:cell division protein FtsW
MYFVAGGEVKHMLIIGTGAFILACIAVGSSDYRMRRVQTFINPESDPLGASFHIRQITLALGRGGVFGQGLGNSAQKLAYIPEPTTDSIFAITAEEVGFAGAVFIIALYGGLLLTFYKIAQSFPSQSFEQLLAAGILIWISMQTILNMAAVVALIPLTGIPLPFFSYGGSSLVMVLWATGFMLKLAYTSTHKKQ